VFAARAIDPAVVTIKDGTRINVQIARVFAVRFFFMAARGKRIALLQSKARRR